MAELICLSEEESNKNIKLPAGSFFNKKDNKNEYRITSKKRRIA